MDALCQTAAYIPTHTLTHILHGTVITTWLVNIDNTIHNYILTDL